MKILKYIVIGLAVLAVGFFAIGLVKSEIDYTCEILVDKPLAECWEVSQDESKMKDWLEGFQRYEMVSGTPGTVGAVSKVYFDNNGEEMVVEETITAIEPNESISMDFDSEFMIMDYKLMMMPKDGKTAIKTISNVEGNGMFSKSIVALMSGYFKTQEETNLERLKKVIEAN